MKPVPCPACGHNAYEYFKGCLNCGAKAGWPEADPTPEQHKSFAKHGLVWVGGSNLKATAPPASLLKDGRGTFDIGLNTPVILSAAFNSGSAVINISDSGASRLNQVFGATGRVGSIPESGAQRPQTGIRLALFGYPGKVHPYPDDVPGSADTIIP